MTSSALADRLRAGTLTVGTLVMEFDTTGVSRIAAAAGAEFVLFDLEHTGWSLETARVLIASTRATRTVPFVRVPAGDSHFIARALDLGAAGIMVPSVETAEQARSIVSAAKYPPIGERRFGLIYSDAQSSGLDATMRAANEQNLLLLQIESTRGLENVEEIARVPGVDVLWLGPYDLTISMQIPARFDDVTYRAAVDRFLAACERHGPVPGVLVEDSSEGRDAIERGFRCLMCGFDAALYEHALRCGIDELRGIADGSR